MTRRPLVFGLGLLAATAWADPRRDAIQRIYGEFKDAVVVVAFQVRAGDDPASPAQPQRVPGVLVDKQGLVMVSALAFPDQVPLSRYDNLRVMTTLGGEDEGYPARLLGRGRNPALAFLRVADASRLAALPVVAFEEADVALGDEILMLAPTDQRDKRTFALGICNLELDGPLRGWGVTSTAPFGCPAFSLDGKAVGVVAGRRTGPQQATAFVLAAKEVLPAVQNPPTAPHLPGAAKPRGWTGLLYVQDVDSRDLAEDLGLPPQSGGMIVGNLIKDSPAWSAGLRVGDVILNVQGAELRRNGRAKADFQEHLQRLGVGERMALEVWREGRRVPLELVTAPMPKTAAQARREILASFGFVAREMVLDDRYAMRLADGEAGVVCDAVTPATWAADAGLAPGDVIKRIGERDIPDLDAFSEEMRRLAEARAGQVFLTVLRGGRATLTLKMEPRWP